MRVRKIDKDELKTILKKHMMWLNGEDGGERADLSYTNLRHANLSYADLNRAILNYADLSYANLNHASLNCADINYADLNHADLSYTGLSYTDLNCTDLSYTNLKKAVMDGADIRDANMNGAKHTDSAKNLFCPLSCPEVGKYIGFKKADGKIVKLKIPADAKRLSATGRKCRASKAVVVSITELDGTPAGDEVCSDYDNSFVYHVGETVEVQNFDENRWNECAPGIHHSITREEAVRY